MQVRVIAVSDLVARRALSARPISRVSRQAEQPRGQIHGERRLPNPCWADKQQRVGRPLALDRAPVEGQR
jgi:hypothetical protein